MVDFIAVAQGIDQNLDTNLEIVHKYSFLLSKLWIIKVSN